MITLENSVPGSSISSGGSDIWVGIVFGVLAP